MPVSGRASARAGEPTHCVTLWPATCWQPARRWLTWGAASPRQRGDNGDLRQGRPGGAGRADPALASTPGRRTAMTLHRAMREMAEDYICLRRSLGFKFRDPNQGWLVRDFARNLDDQHVTRVTTQAAAAWATLPSTSLAWHSCRLSVARGFAGYLHALDPVHQVPPADLIPSRYHRPSPCLFSAAGIAALIQAAGTLRPALRAATLQTVIALLATTGIRPGEAVALNREHVDLHNAVLTVASTKFGKSLVNVLPST